LDFFVDVPLWSAPELTLNQRVRVEVTPVYVLSPRLAVRLLLRFIHIQIEITHATKIAMKYGSLATLTFISLFLAAGDLDAQSTALENAENVIVYRSIEVVVNKSIVIRLPKNAIRVALTQPQIAEVMVVAPDQLLINGKAVGTTSLVVWYEQKSRKR
jgi:Flp pilus assembly secretin CpaC